MTKILLQIFSFLGSFLGLITLIYLPFRFWFVAFSFFFIIWGIISFLYLSENGKYLIFLRIFSLIGAFTACLFIIFSIWGFISIGYSLILGNFLILSLIFGLFILTWSLLCFKFIKIKKNETVKKEK